MTPTKCIEMAVNDDGNFVPQRCYDVVNDFSGVTVQKIKKPLVVSLIIQDYSQTESYGYPSLDINGVLQDHKNISQLNSKYRYHQAYMVENNNKSQLKHLIKEEDEKIEYKLSFTAAEIDAFNDMIIKVILNEKNEHKYDGLMYFIEGRGEEYDQLITSSPEDTFWVQEIFNKYSNKNCPCLRNKPKIFFIEMERGGLQNPKYKNKILKMQQTKKKLTDQNEPTKVITSKTNMYTTKTCTDSKVSSDITDDVKDDHKKPAAIDHDVEDEKEDERSSIKKFYQDEEDMRFIYSCAKGFKGNLRFKEFNMASILFRQAVTTLSKSVETKRSLDDTIIQMKRGIDNDIRTVSTTHEMTSIEDTNRIHDQIIFRSRSKKSGKQNTNNNSTIATAKAKEASTSSVEVNSLLGRTDVAVENQVQEAENNDQMSANPPPRPIAADNVNEPIFRSGNHSDDAEPSMGTVACDTHTNKFTLETESNQAKLGISDTKSTMVASKEKDDERVQIHAQQSWFDTMCIPITALIICVIAWLMLT